PPVPRAHRAGHRVRLVGRGGYIAYEPLSRFEGAASLAGEEVPAAVVLREVRLADHPRRSACPISRPRPRTDRASAPWSHPPQRTAGSTKGLGRDTSVLGPERQVVVPAHRLLRAGRRAA